jgi:hypothetical protein
MPTETDATPTTHTFNRGDTVYGIDGQQAEYLMAYEDAHLVLPHFREDEDDWGGHPWPSEPAVWQEVFTKPPVPVVHEEVAAARVELDEIEKQVREAEQQLRAMREERQQLQRDQSAVVARLKQHRQLTRIDDWLAGNITHLVVWEHYGRRVEVKTWAEFMKGDGRRDSMPLLVLNGTLEWVDDYARMGIDWILTKKDSNGTQRVLLCNSEAEARERAAEAIEKLTADRMRQRRNNRSNGYDHELEDCVKSMQALGIPISEDVTAAYAESRQAAAQTCLTHARRQIEKAASDLQAAEAEARAAGVEITSQGTPA